MAWGYLGIPTAKFITHTLPSATRLSIKHFPTFKAVIRAIYFSCMVLLVGSLTQCHQSSEGSAARYTLEIPRGDQDEILNRLIPFMASEPQTLLQEEINFLIDQAIEGQWDVHYQEPGILYHISNAGRGAKPSWGSYVSVHYSGWQLTGTLFDSSRKREQPFNFYVGNVIPAWNEALMHVLPEGARGLLVVPSSLAYGKSGFGKFVAPGDHLAFDIELLKILPDPVHSQD